MRTAAAVVSVLAALSGASAFMPTAPKSFTRTRGVARYVPRLPRPLSPCLCAFLFLLLLGDVYMVHLEVCV